MGVRGSGAERERSRAKGRHAPVCRNVDESDGTDRRFSIALRDVADAAGHGDGEDASYGRREPEARPGWGCRVAILFEATAASDPSDRSNRVSAIC